jgi:NADPH:quinone reductase-like Zn-dependent oxidoreductase
MLAALQIAPGERVRCRHVPDLPLPGDGELLVAMRRAPVNPADLLLVGGRYAFPVGFPHIPGAEGVGEVLATGAAVRGIHVGDRVLPLTRGNWAARRLLAAEDVVVVPPSLPDDAAAMLRINPATAWRMLRVAPIAAGDWIVQNAATSGVARWVRRLAADLGCRVVDVVRSEAQARALRHAVVDGADLAAQVAAFAGGGAVSLALDCVAGDASGRLASALSSGGTLIVFGHLSGAPCRIESTLLTGRMLAVRGFSLRPTEVVDDRTALGALYADLAVIAEEEAMAPAVAASYPLDEIEAALDHAARPGLGGRIMLDLDH